MPDTAPKGPSTRVAAIVGPYTSGKTSLLESLLFTSQALTRKGSAVDGSRVGDASEEAKHRQMSVETVTASTTFLDDNWTLLDCPGSVEFLQDTRHALMVADIAIVVCDPDPARAVMVAPFLKFLDDYNIPHLIFINRMEHAKAGLSEIFQALQEVSDRPLIMRQMPIMNEGAVTGYVDLINERAYHYEDGKPSTLISVPSDISADEQGLRQELLENLADFDDALMEELLNDAEPPKVEVYQSLTKDIADNKLVPVLFGEAELDHGVNRLWKALRHDAPWPDVTWAHRKELAPEGNLQVFKIQHATHTGRLSWARVWQENVAESTVIAGVKLAGLYAINGSETSKISSADLGAIVALGRVDGTKPGHVLTEKGPVLAEIWPAVYQPLYAKRLSTVKVGDDVKLTTSLAKLCEDDMSLSFGNDPDTGELLLWGQGDIHLQVAIAHLANVYNVVVQADMPSVPFKETIQVNVTERGRYKRQTGGHGQFGDVLLEVRPLARGDGFAFTDKIVGGVVPKQYIPAVEAGARESLQKGPLGFPVVDVGVTLSDGSFHAVDSSEQAFKTAAGIGMREALSKSQPILLEPIWSIALAVPSEWTSKAQRALSQRRAQIMGYEDRPGWRGWDVIKAKVPQMEVSDLISELRSLTMGVGTFEWSFDHLQELTGRVADMAIGAKEQKAS